MKAPDKIYINGWSAFATEPVKDGVQYIHKDALLEWAKNMRRNCRGAEPIEKAYQTMIDKIESL